VKAETVEEMSKSVAKALPSADVLVMAAAPADFRPAEKASAKIKKGHGGAKLDLEQTEDILKSTIPKRKKKSLVVGFALETGDGLESARQKLRVKDLDIVVLNDATEPGAGFGVDTNRATLIDRAGTEEKLQLMSKVELAEVLLDRIEEKLNGR
jgi:phosphopantothenoylcysteine decarboxylase/phosphopantothenate--cysteine ligase